MRSKWGSTLQRNWIWWSLLVADGACRCHTPPCAPGAQWLSCSSSCTSTTGGRAVFQVVPYNIHFRGHFTCFYWTDLWQRERDTNSGHDCSPEEVVCQEQGSSEQGSHDDPSHGWHPQSACLGRTAGRHTPSWMLLLLERVTACQEMAGSNPPSYVT